LEQRGQNIENSDEDLDGNSDGELDGNSDGELDGNSDEILMRF
jgi:hypothetical protein